MQFDPADLPWEIEKSWRRIEKKLEQVVDYIQEEGGFDNLSVQDQEMCHRIAAAFEWTWLGAQRSGTEFFTKH